MSFDPSKCDFSMFSSQNVKNVIVEASRSPTSGDNSTPLELCPDLSNQTDEAVDALLEALHAKALKIQVKFESKFKLI